MVLLFDLQLKVGAVTQHGLLLLHILPQAKDPEGQIQNLANPRLHWARSEVHGHRLHNVHLGGNRTGAFLIKRLGTFDMLFAPSRYETFGKINVRIKNEGSIYISMWANSLLKQLCSVNTSLWLRLTRYMESRSQQYEKRM